MPGLRCQVSYNGGPFTDYVTQQVISFAAPEMERDDGCLFGRGRWLLSTPRTGVVISHDGGGYGWNEWLE